MKLPIPALIRLRAEGADARLGDIDRFTTVADAVGDSHREELRDTE